MMKQRKNLRNFCVHCEFNTKEMSELRDLTRMSLTLILVYEKRRNVLRILKDRTHFHCLAPVVLCVIVSVACSCRNVIQIFFLENLKIIRKKDFEAFSRVNNGTKEEAGSIGKILNLK